MKTFQTQWGNEDKIDHFVTLQEKKNPQNLAKKTAEENPEDCT